MPERVRTDDCLSHSRAQTWQSVVQRTLYVAPRAKSAPILRGSLRALCYRDYCRSAEEMPHGRIKRAFQAHAARVGVGRRLGRRERVRRRQVRFVAARRPRRACCAGRPARRVPPRAPHSACGGALAWLHRRARPLTRRPGPQRLEWARVRAAWRQQSPARGAQRLPGATCATQRGRTTLTAPERPPGRLARQQRLRGGPRDPPDSERCSPPAAPLRARSARGSLGPAGGTTGARPGGAAARCARDDTPVGRAAASLPEPLHARGAFHAPTVLTRYARRAMPLPGRRRGDGTPGGCARDPGR